MLVDTHRRVLIVSDFLSLDLSAEFSFFSLRSIFTGWLSMTEDHARGDGSVTGDVRSMSSCEDGRVWERSGKFDLNYSPQFNRHKKKNNNNRSSMDGCAFVSESPTKEGTL